MQTQPKRGDHRAHIACHTGLQTHSYSITFDKGRRSRQEEEAVLAGALLRICAYHGQVPADTIPGWPLRAPQGYNDAMMSSVSMDMLVKGQESDSAAQQVDGTDAARGQVAAVQALLDGELSCVEVSGPAGGRRVLVDAPRHNVALLPGSFNPLHDGHRCAGAHAALVGTPQSCRGLSLVNAMLSAACRVAGMEAT